MNLQLIIRDLRADDYSKHYLRLSNQLSDAGDISEELFAKIVSERTQRGIYTWVAEDEGRIIATVSLLLERKLYRYGRYAGHIEDVIVDEHYRHHRLGTMLVRHALEKAKALGCYKVILDCKNYLEAFYNGAGFEKHGVQMARYL